jgi:zinc/manganese transport system substrate-binding protein
MDRRVSAGRASRGGSLALAAGLALGPLLTAACSTPAPAPGVIDAVGAENMYADVLAQIGGRYVHVSSVLNNPNTDPHTFESSPSVAREVSAAELVVQNGVGYDDFMGRVESASPSARRRVVVVQRLLGLPDTTPNPHLWYSPATMPQVAGAVADALSALQPRHRSYFAANAARFDASLAPWTSAISAFRAQYGGTAVATTEPVADYLLDAMGADNLTPFRFQADIMNGVDPAPQDISLEHGFFTTHKVKVFCDNEQVTSSLTLSIRNAAKAAGIPVVGVYETMPSGYDYQDWMVAEVRAIEAAVSSGKSTEHL